MFEYSKEILTKVSFDRTLFNKELVKAIKWLKADERNLLMMWCLATFGNKYSDVIIQAFRHVVK